MAEQTWLFRQGDLILGPVPTKVLVDKLFSGELNGMTEVQLMGSGLFRKLKDVPELKVHWAKAEAKARVDAQDREQARQRRQRTLSMVAIAAGVLLLVGVGVAALGSYLAIHGGSADDAYADISIDTPVIARARRDGEELIDYQMGKRPLALRPNGPSGPSPNAPASGAALPTAPKPKPGSAEADGLAVGEVDQDAIQSVVSKYKSTLTPCIREVAKPGMPPTKIPIEFSVLETGKVGRVWVDNPDFKNGPLVECLSRELAKWPFKPQPSGANVQLAFNIGKNR